MENLKTSPEAKGHRVVAFPEKPNIWIGNLSLASVQKRYKAGDEEICKQVEDTLAAAEKWAAKPDAWYLETIWHREPRGIFTCACPMMGMDVSPLTKSGGKITTKRGAGHTKGSPGITGMGKPTDMWNPRTRFTSRRSAG